LPVFTFCQNGSANNCIQTTDPGKALTSKLFNDIGKFRIPVLRSLSSRAPYFHNGSAQTLDDVIGFYVNRFGIQFNGTEREDLEAFLGAL
jgi:cytochrome c peroxidase